MGEISREALDPGKWIWAPENRKNHYVLFVKNLESEPGIDEIKISITASYHYELYVNGEFLNRGPVHGDPRWCSYDVVTFRLQPTRATTRVPTQIAVVVHHCTDTYLHCLTPAPPGLRVRVEAGDRVMGSDETWGCQSLEMWSNDVEERGWALGYCEDYDARLEPAGWQTMTFGDSGFRGAVIVENSRKFWSGYHKRIPPYLRRRPIDPKSSILWQASGDGAGKVYDLSALHDDEPLSRMENHKGATGEANAVTYDLGKEYVGFYEIDVHAAAGTIVEISGAELLKPDGSGRPWIFRKGTCYTVRYICGGDRRRFRSFSWNGFRYIHVVVRGGAVECLRGVCCLERKAPLTYTGHFTTDDAQLTRIFNLCRRTLEVGVFEHTADCPTREQAPAWADSAFISQGIYLGFGDSSYLVWYLEAYIRAPLNEHGLICGRYPGTKGIWLDFCLIPILAQRWYREYFGGYYKPDETLKKCLELKKWYDMQLDENGLVSFDFKEYYARGLRNFIDHPGLGMHNAGHPGIDRDGASCGLNCFFYGFVRELSGIATAVGDTENARQLAEQADTLRSAIRERFWDGRVYHDTDDPESGTSWQTNGIAVYMGVATPDEAPGILKTMLDGYDTLCRCTPYTYVYFLQALRIADMESEARELIKREWSGMIEAGATTTWEGFLGDERDSLCHPFSTAPFMFLLSAPS